MNRFLSRRALLRGAGGASIALPFLASWRGDSGWDVVNVSTAHADNRAPKRIVFVVTEHGMMHRYFNPKNTSADRKTFELGEIMAPLAPYKDKLTVLSGINMASIKYQETTTPEHGPPDPHSVGAAHSLSSIGYRFSEVPWGPKFAYRRPTGPSIDFALAQRLGGATRFPSLCIGDEITGEGVGRWRALNGTDNTDPGTESNPRRLYDRLFKDFAGDSANREKQARGRLAAVSQAVPAYKHLSTRLSTRDKLLLDAHMDSLSALEKRLRLKNVCTAPAEPATINYHLNADSPAEGPYQDLFEMAGLSLACDLTRVMVLGIGGQDAHMSSIIPNIQARGLGGEDHHSITHANVGEETRVEGLKDAHIWRMRQIAKFVEKLATTPDTDGRMMLDNTCIVHTSNMILGTHYTLPQTNASWFSETGVGKPLGLPIFLLGGLGGAIKTGLHLDLSSGSTYGTDLGKYSHGELYLTLARAMGISALDMPSFGEPAVCKQVISEILA